MGDEGKTDHEYPRNLTLTIAVSYLSNYFPPDDQGVIWRAGHSRGTQHQTGRPAVIRGKRATS